MLSNHNTRKAHKHISQTCNSVGFSCPSKLWHTPVARYAATSTYSHYYDTPFIAAAVIWWRQHKPSITAQKYLARKIWIKASDSLKKASPCSLLTSQNKFHPVLHFLCLCSKYFCSVMDQKQVGKAKSEKCWCSDSVSTNWKHKCFLCFLNHSCNELYLIKHNFLQLSKYRDSTSNSQQFLLTEKETGESSMQIHNTDMVTLVIRDIFVYRNTLSKTSLNNYFIIFLQHLCSQYQNWDSGI